VFGKSKRTVALLAGAAGLNLLLGVAVASGVVPQANSVSVASKDVAQEVGHALPPLDVQPDAAAVEAVFEAPPETAPPTNPPATTAPTTSVTAKAAVQTPASTPAPDPAPTSAAEPLPAPAASTAVPRLNPASFQVFQAIQHLSLRIPLFKPTEAQARQFGDTVCTAFDEGKSYAEVRAGVLSAVGQVPGLTVTAADADYAIRTAVDLFCPGHRSKLP
jgi:hypothetical protein